MEKLRLIAVDADDLTILSAHCQDALTKLSECRYFAREQRFIMAMNRFVWEEAQMGERKGLARLLPLRRREYERRRAVLHFERVRHVAMSGLDPAAMAETVLSLLSIRFNEAEAPSGSIELVFAGGSAIRLDVECVEARLTDTGGAWSTTARPDHDRPDPAD
ncbi:DUF2948 family protein [Mangrovicella endophytica]|uniref:DUF2948 family protein n=1 Tax=Mangrovicella endophytica TaxID=2066697 RepID=UPI000C9DEE64|nr:DUF2948 family protein [Mangrovicella endophytica]